MWAGYDSSLMLEVVFADGLECQALIVGLKVEYVGMIQHDLKDEGQDLPWFRIPDHPILQSSLRSVSLAQSCHIGLVVSSADTPTGGHTKEPGNGRRVLETPPHHWTRFLGPLCRRKMSCTCAAPQAPE